MGFLFNQFLPIDIIIVECCVWYHKKSLQALKWELERVLSIFFLKRVLKIQSYCQHMMFEVMLLIYSIIFALFLNKFCIILHEMVVSIFFC